MQDQLTLTFTALSDPTRRAILAKLSHGEATVKDLAKPFDMSGPAITKHLKVLEKAGLISRGREAQWRPCRIEPEALKGVADWVSEYKQIWEESFDRLDAYLKTMTQKKMSTKNKKKKGIKNGRKK
jgi:DNA-binding transcriptional ArsR family regulator